MRLRRRRVRRNVKTPATRAAVVRPAPRRSGALAESLSVAVLALGVGSSVGAGLCEVGVGEGDLAARSA